MSCPSEKQRLWAKEVFRVIGVMGLDWLRGSREIVIRDLCRWLTPREQKRKIQLLSSWLFWGFSPQGLCMNFPSWCEHPPDPASCLFIHHILLSLEKPQSTNHIELMIHFAQGRSWIHFSQLDKCHLLPWTVWESFWNCLWTCVFQVNSSFVVSGMCVCVWYLWTFSFSTAWLKKVTQYLLMNKHVVLNSVASVIRKMLATGCYTLHETALAHSSLWC